MWLHRAGKFQQRFGNVRAAWLGDMCLAMFRQALIFAIRVLDQVPFGNVYVRLRIRIVFKRFCMRNALLGSLIFKHDAVASRQWSWRCLQGATETEATALLRTIHFPAH